VRLGIMLTGPRQNSSGFNGDSEMPFTEAKGKGTVTTVTEMRPTPELSKFYRLVFSP
jgi:hypothetical protein